MGTALAEGSWRCERYLCDGSQHPWKAALAPPWHMAAFAEAPELGVSVSLMCCGDGDSAAGPCAGTGLSVQPWAHHTAGTGGASLDQTKKLWNILEDKF